MFAAPHYDAFIKKHGNVSLPFALFSTAAPPTALSMMEQGFISDLNEKDDSGISLLGIHMRANNPRNGLLPSWGEWEKDSAAIWSPDQFGSAQHLLASMIFSGADPWVEWDPEKLDKRCRCLFAQAVCANNVNLVRLLFSHPACPPATYFDKLEIENYEIVSENYRSRGKITCSPLHVAVNSGSVELIGALLEKGLDVNVLDSKERPPLFYAQDVLNAQKIINAGANLGIVDENDQTVGIYWKNTLGTAAKQAAFNKILIEKMKGSMTPEELCEMQKPSLFNEISKGTKTNFETVYRKAKFSPSVTYNTRGLSLNLLSAALARNDEKCSMFVSWCQDKKVPWDHLLDKDNDFSTNALFSVLMSSSHGRTTEDALNVLRAKYGSKNSFAGFHDDLFSFSKILFDANYQVTRSLFNIMNLSAAYVEKSINPSSDLGYELKSSLYLHEIFEKIKGEKIALQSQDLTLHPLFNTALSQGVVALTKEAIKKENKIGYGYNAIPHYAIGVIEKHLMERFNKNPTPEDAKSLLWILMYQYALGHNELNYINKPSAQAEMRLRFVEQMRDKMKNALPSCEDLSLFSELMSRIEKNPSKPSMAIASTAVSAMLLDFSIGQRDSAPTVKRRM